MPNPKLDQFDHLVVVMFENRSFDSVLGYLYEAGNVPRGQNFNGVAGKSFSNPVPAYMEDGHSEVTTRLSPGTDADMSNPNPDPGEEYQHVNTQLFGNMNPASNEFQCAAQMTSPWNNPATGQQPAMQGFVHDYISNYVSSANGCKSSVTKKLPAFEDYRIIMDGFGPESLPVLNTLAREFAVFDAWHAGVPSQTFPNRAFFHASTSSGYVVNEPYEKWLSNEAETIFNRLSDAGIPWKIYYDHTQVVSLTALTHLPKLRDYLLSHLGSMEDFYADAAKGSLPAYSFIEPRLFYHHNDYHPPSPTADILGVEIGATSDMRNGELLLHNIYEAVRTSKDALKTLLLVTFDEHGGTFDHVAPPSATPPHPGMQAGSEFGFGFDRLGVRVPAIAISAYTKANTVVNTPMHHGAVIRTLCEKFDLPHLTDRDKTANDISDALNIEDEPRHPNDWPITKPRPVAPPPDPAVHQLNGLERHIVGLAMSAFEEHGAIPTTIGEARTLLSRLKSTRPLVAQSS